MANRSVKYADASGPLSFTRRTGVHGGPRPHHVAATSMLDVPSRFQLREELGRGGMGMVFRAYDRSAGHELALKLLHGISAEDRLQLKGEFRAVSEVIHPNLVDLYELFIEERACFFTMELVNGTDFARYVAGLGAIDKDPHEWHARFREVARQLALAIHALHQGDRLHRDVKPSNVLVTDARRTVLLDFGLAISATRQVREEERLVGTLSYMSPEQRWGRELLPASDWYSFGMTLYESISGKVASGIDLLGSSPRSKLRGRGIDIDPEIDELILGLLSSEPSARPDVRQILKCLGSTQSAERAVSVLPRVVPELVGREAPLERLRELLFGDAAAKTRAVRLHGSSGIGKSSLMRAFLEPLGGSGSTLVLKSGCHPQEAVAFNAIDGFIDDLANQLGERLTIEERCLPFAQHAALKQIFPVLAKVLTSDEPAPPSYASGRERRELAFVALSEILARLGRKLRVVVWLDDVQWGDQDSGMLLRYLLSSEERPPLLWVLSYRGEDERSSPCLQVLREDTAAWEAMLPMPLGPLDLEQSRELVRGLMGADWQGDEAIREELIRSAAGSPFLLAESARYLTTHADGASAPAPGSNRVGFDQILSVRTRDLPEDCRAVLEVLAVAGAPLEQQLTLTAAGIDSARRGLITDLHRLSIVRTTDIKSHCIEFYHDKLREEVVRQLDEDARAAHHRSIARAVLECSPPNPLMALEHFEAAGDTESVRRYVTAAANHASKLLAFERAARLYRRAIELEPGDVPLHELYRRLGSALASEGRGREAAEAYSAAAKRLLNDANVRTDEFAQLQQRAAEQFIQTGHFGRGTEMIRSVLAELEVSLPKTREEAHRKAALLRLVALARGLTPKERTVQVADLELRRFDALWAANTRLAMIDYALCNYATARCALDSLRLGEPSRMSRALSMEASFCSLLPQPMFQKRADKLLQMAEHFATQGGDPEYDALFAVSARAIISFYRGRFEDTWRQADRAIGGRRELSRGRTWEEAPWQMWSLLGLALNGEWAELVRRVEEAREDAERRDDRHVELNISLGAPAIAWLLLDRPDEARWRADRALSWSPPGYSAQHYQHYVTVVDCLLYRGDGLGAWARTLDTWSLHKREQFLRLSFLRDDLLRTRARSALAAVVALRAANQRRTESGHDVRALLTDARRAAREMDGHGADYARGFAALVRAGIAGVEGNPDRAVQELELGLAAFERGHLQSFREIARYCLGRLKRDAEGTAALEQAEAWLSEQGVVRPDRVAATLVPGLF